MQANNDEEAKKVTAITEEDSISNLDAQKVNPRDYSNLPYPP